METIKQQQQIILLQLQNNLRKPIEVPEVTGIPLKTLEELLNLEQSVAAQGEHKQKLVGVDIGQKYNLMRLLNHHSF